MLIATLSYIKCASIQLQSEGQLTKVSNDSKKMLFIL